MYNKVSKFFFKLYDIWSETWFYERECELMLYLLQ